MNLGEPHSPPARRRGLVALLRLATPLALVVSGCIVEPPYQSGSEETPFTVELIADAPVVTFDIVLTTLVRGSSATLELSGVDPRVRVAVTGDADVDRNGDADGLATFFHPADGGTMSVPLRANGDCAAPPCPIQRLIIELVDPAAGERLMVQGAVRVQYGYPGATRHPGRAMTVEGFGPGTARPAGTQRTTTVSAEPVTLDAEHALAFQPITFDLGTGLDASALDLVAEASLVGDAAEATDGYDLSLRWHSDPDLQAPFVFQTGRRRWAPTLGCTIGADCQNPAFVRLAYDGALPTATVNYGIETTLVSYADEGLSEQAALTATFAPTFATPAGAPRVTASHEGTLVLERDTVRAEMRIRLGLDDLPSPPDPRLVEVPGVVLLTYSVVPAIQPIEPAHRYVALSWTSFDPVRYNPGVDLIPDGGTHTVMLNLLEPCRLGQPCTTEVLFTLYDAAINGVSKPLTLAYRFDVAVTSFDDVPFPPGAAVTIGMAPPRPTPTPR